MAFTPVLIKNVSQAHEDYNDDYDDYDEDDYDDDDEKDNVCLKGQNKHNAPGFAPSGGKAKTTPKASDFSEVNEDDCAPELPAKWSYISLSLFDNANLTDQIKNKRKLKVSISVKLKHTGQFVNLTASLNSPFRNLKRGLTSAEYAQTHYQNVKQVYQMLKPQSDDLYVSKFYQTGRLKGHTVKELSTIVMAQPELGNYQVILFIATDILEFRLTPQGLTQSQINKGMIARASQGGITSVHVNDIL